MAAFVTAALLSATPFLPNQDTSANLDTLYHGTDEEDDPLPSGLNASMECGARVTHARIAGDYYRDLSANYAEYERTDRWPEHPFPNERYTWHTIEL